jgi:biopolymer transport protein ExbD
MFIQGDHDLDYGKVAEVVNMGSEAGVDHVALITPRMAAGQ